MYPNINTNMSYWQITRSIKFVFQSILSIHECIHEYFQKVFVFVFEYILFSCIRIRIHEIGKYSYSYSNTLWSIRPMSGSNIDWKIKPNLGRTMNKSSGNARSLTRNNMWVPTMSSIVGMNVRICCKYCLERTKLTYKDFINIKIISFFPYAINKN